MVISYFCKSITSNDNELFLWGNVANPENKRYNHQWSWSWQTLSRSWSWIIFNRFFNSYQSDTLDNANAGDIVIFKPCNSKSFHEKIFHYSVLESSRDVLQEYIIKNRSSI